MKTTGYPMPALTIATRQSALALWQANWVKIALEKQHPDLQITLLPLTTKGDEILDKSLSKIGGKGLFVKELEMALLAGHADIAVHSMKDVPMDLPDGLSLPVICERDNPQDSLLSIDQHTLDSLPPQALVGSSSLRRQSQLLKMRPDLRIQALRGNINTRLKKLEAGEFSAIILAQAGIERLQIGLHYASALSTDLCLPAAGQGALGIECRTNDLQTQRLIAPLHHAISAACVLTERAMVRYCKGDCQVPIAAYAQYQQNSIFLKGLIAEPDASRIYQASNHGPIDAIDTLGINVAKALIDAGAEVILEKYR